MRIPWASKLEHGSIKDLIGNSEYKKYSNGTAEAATINTEPPPIGWGKDFFLSQRVNDFPQTVTFEIAFKDEAHNLGLILIDDQIAVRRF